MKDRRDAVRRLACWSAAIEITEIKGGITNANFRVDTGNKSYFVRTGADILHHGIMRFNEREASQAAAVCSLSPKLIHHEPGALVFEFIDGKTLTPEDVRHPDRLNKITDLLRLCHSEMKHHIRGPALIFWVFHVIRDY